MGTYIGTSIPSGLGDGVSPDLAKQLEHLDPATLDPSAAGSVPADPYVAAERAAQTKAPHTVDLTNLHHHHNAPTGKQIPGGYQNLAEQYGLSPQASTTSSPAGTTGAHSSQSTVGSSSQPGYAHRSSAASTKSASNPYLNYGSAVTRSAPSAGHESKAPVQYPDAGQVPSHHHHHHHHHEPAASAGGLQSSGASSLSSPQAYRTTDPVYANKISASNVSLAPSSKKAPSPGEYEGLGEGAVTGAGVGRGADISLAGFNPTPSANAKPTPTAARGTAAEALKHDEPSGRTVGPASGTTSTQSAKTAETAHSTPGAYPGSATDAERDSTPGNILSSLVAAPAGALASVYEWIHPETGEKQTGPRPAQHADSAAPASNTRETKDQASIPSSTSAGAAKNAPTYSAYSENVPTTNVDLSSSAATNTTTQDFRGGLTEAAAKAIAAPLETLTLAGGAAGTAGSAATNQAGQTVERAADMAGNLIQKASDGVSGAFSSSGAQSSQASQGTPAYASAIAAPLESVALAGDGFDNVGQAAERQAVAAKPAALETVSLPARSIAVPATAGGALGSPTTPTRSSGADSTGIHPTGTRNLDVDSIPKYGDFAQQTPSKDAYSSHASGAGGIAQPTDTQQRTSTYGSSRPLPPTGTGNATATTASTVNPGLHSRDTDSVPIYPHAKEAAPTAGAGYNSLPSSERGTHQNTNLGAGVPAVGALSTPVDGKFVDPSKTDETSSVRLAGESSRGANQVLEVGQFPESQSQSTPATGNPAHSSGSKNLGAGVPAVGALSTPVGGKFVDPSKTDETSSVPLAGKSSRGANQVLEVGQFPESQSQSTPATGNPAHSSGGKNLGAGVPAVGALSTPVGGKFVDPSKTDETSSVRLAGESSRGANQVLEVGQFPESQSQSTPATGNPAHSSGGKNLGAGVPAVGALSTPVDGKFVDPSKTDETSSVPLAGKSSRGANQVLEVGQFPESQSQSTPATGTPAHSSGGQNLGAGVPAVGALSTPVDGKFVDPSKTDETSSVPLAGKSSRGANQVLEEGQSQYPTVGQAGQGSSSGYAKPGDELAADGAYPLSHSAQPPQPTQSTQSAPSAPSGTRPHGQTDPNKPNPLYLFGALDDLVKDAPPA